MNPLPSIRVVDAAPPPLGGSSAHQRKAEPKSRSVAAGILRGYEALAIAASGLVTWLVCRQLGGAVTDAAAVAVIALATLGAGNLLQLVGTYRLHQWRVDSARWPVAWLAIMLAVTTLLWAGGGLTRASGEWLAAWFALGALALLTGRALLVQCVRMWRREGQLATRIAVIGAGPIGQRLLRHLNGSQDATLVIAGLYDDRRSRLPRSCMGHAIRGTVDDLIQDAREGRIDSVIVALPLSAGWRLAEVMRKLSLIPVDVRMCADMAGFEVAHCRLAPIDGVPALEVRPHPLRGGARIAKAVEDRILAALILALVSPIMLVTAILVRLDSPGPILFKQKRHGYNNQMFEVLKFRSLYHDQADQNAEKLAGNNDPRVTRVGAFIRRSMIDELPQFINVLRGDMSIVGPRPHAMAAKAGGVLYRDAVQFYDARHRMKPGITGWAQVNGWHGETKTLEDIRQRVAHDLYYIEHWSIFMDLTIILRTAMGRIVAFLPRRKGEAKSHELPLADTRRSRSAA